MIDNAKDPNLRVLLTPQEFYFLGGTLCGNSNQIRYLDEPYVPFAVQDGRDAVAVNFERRDEEFFLVPPWTFRDESGEELPVRGKPVRVALSPLNIMTGETVFDPMPLDKRLKLNTEDPAPYQLRYPSKLLD